MDNDDDMYVPACNKRVDVPYELQTDTTHLQLTFLQIK